MKRKIRLTESDLHRIVKKSVNKLLAEETGNVLGKPWNPMEGPADSFQGGQFYLPEGNLTSVDERLAHGLKELVSDMKCLYEMCNSIANGGMGRLGQKEQTDIFHLKEYMNDFYTNIFKLNNTK
jgi:hypothetical protein